MLFAILILNKALRHQKWETTEMPASSVASLGEYTVRFGDFGDADRIKKMVNKECNVDIDLDPRCIVSEEDTVWKRGLATWPVGDRRHILVLVRFKIPMRGFEAIYKESIGMTEKMGSLKLGMFPHLAVLSSQAIVDDLRSKGVQRIAVCDPNSLWKMGRGRFNVPYLECNCPRQGFRSKWVGEMWDINTSYLFYISRI